MAAHAISSMRLGLIIDNGKLTRWQQDALAQIGDHEVVLILNCTNTRTKKRPFKHALYYILNLLAVRGPHRERIPLDSALLGSPAVIDFESEYQRAWQLIPDDVIRNLAEARVDAVVKFGMSLLIVPEPDVLPAPILSYHHGDPDQYRGRPAGFYELLNGADTMGVMVQVLSNELDAGEVVAFGELPTTRHSLKRTLSGAYGLSPLLLGQALKNLKASSFVDKHRQGTNYRLPSNSTVARFALALGFRRFRRALYGAFMEKRWHVSTIPGQPFERIFSDNFDESEQVTPIRPPYSFYADPFFAGSERLIVEAMSRRTGKGVLLLVDREQHSPLTTASEHHSYPSVYESENGIYVLPEIASWATPRLYRLHDKELVFVSELEIEDDPRVLDPTLFRSADTFYLFGNDARHGSHVLSLWFSRSIVGPYFLHRDSPIRISPHGGRMAGGVIREGDRIYRLGQDNRRGYGNGIIVFAVQELTEANYREEVVRTIRFRNRMGPHTLNGEGGRFCFDWYVEKFDPTAGYRRLIGRGRRGSAQTPNREPAG